MTREGMTDALDDALRHRLLDRMPVARLALIDDDGCPEAMPIVFARVGEHLYSPIDGKPKRSARLSRLAWIAARPQAGLTLDHYADAWNTLWWLRITATAGIVHENHADFAYAAAALRAKYPQYATTPLFNGTPTMIELVPTGWRWWAAGGLAGIAAWLERDVGT